MSESRAARSIKIEPGTEIKVRALRWDDGWEFDCPVAVIDPVLRVYEDGRQLEDAIEDLCIDAAVDESLTDEGDLRWGGAPGGSLGYLRRKFHRKNVERADVTVRFFLDGKGKINWNITPVNKGATNDTN